MENFCSAAGHGLQAGIFKLLHPFRDGELSLADHIIELYCCEAFYMEIWPVGADLAEELTEELKVHFRVNAAYYVHFCNWLAIVLANDVEHLLHAHFPAIIAVLVLAGVGAEVAGEYTNVCGLYMEVAIEIDFAVVQPAGNMISQ